ncbi:MAG: glycosyltransferase family 4 protein [Acidimicrobiaceae bacterium]|nr:glycosyltransferase family 4 protein [Acidimicrobiaceae bacterium]
MRNVGVVSYRLGLVDGVSIEARKWMDALRDLGWRVRTVAGEGPVDVTIRGLCAHDEGPVDVARLRDALAGCDLVIAENILSLPMNPRARDAVAETLRSRSAIIHHHDLPWQRAHLAHEPDPPDDPAWLHVTINDLSRHELHSRGIDAIRLYNHFDCDPPAGRREWTRRLLNVADDERVILAPTRAIPRKNIALAAEVALASGALLWVLGPPEDGYDAEFSRLLGDLGDRQRQGSPPGVTIEDAYAASDAVAVTSTWEGFGNPVMEAFVHERPLVLHSYPVARELLEMGFEVFSPEDPSTIATEFEHPDLARRQRNHRRVRQFLNLHDLPARLDKILGTVPNGSR